MTTRCHSYAIAILAGLLFLANPAAVFAAYTPPSWGRPRR